MMRVGMSILLNDLNEHDDGLAKRADHLQAHLEILVEVRTQEMEFPFRVALWTIVEHRGDGLVIHRRPPP